MKLFNPGLKTKILTLLLVFISISASILILSTYNKLRTDIFQKNEEIFQTFINTFYSEQDTLTKKYSMSLDILMEDRAILEAFKNRDRKQLDSLVSELYNSRLKHFYNIEQFQFHLPPAVSFYRAHAPARFGDDLSPFRKTVLRANTEKTMVAGLEVGRAGLGLRVVKPVWYNYNYLGSVELGGSIDNLLLTPANASNVHYAVGVSTKALQKSRFFYTDENRYTYKNMYMYNYSSMDIKQLITRGLMDRIEELVKMDEKYYVVKNIPLRDFSSDQIGYLLLCRDTTLEVKAMFRELWKQVAIIVSYAIMTVSLLTIVLIKLIFSPLDKITTHISSVQTGLEMPKRHLVLKGQSEISTLANTFNILNDKLAESFEKINNQMTEIQQINTSLENRVQERTKQLEDANTRLKSAMNEIQLANEAKSEFLANMSHEIRTPMNAVLGLSYLLMQTELTGKQYDYVSKVRNSANLLLEIINDILDFSKIEAGKLELERSVFNIKECIRKLAGMIEVSVSRKNVSLEVLIDNNIPDYLIGDPLRITQVLNNLGTNAAKFTEQGSITIEAKLLTKNDSYARINISVKDTGLGIPEDKLPTLFDSFTQVKRKEQRKHAGSGLGLSISKKILDAMGSDITVHSVEGEGSTFSFIITFLIAADSDIEQLETSSDKFIGKRVLVCEQKLKGKESATTFFRNNVADVISVNNGEELVNTIKKNINENNALLFNLIVLDDKTMTDEAIASLKETLQNVRKDTCPPFILISGDANVTESANRELIGYRLFVLHIDNACEHMVGLATELLGGDSAVNADIECLKRNRLTSSGIKALIADDNEINLQVITEFADMLGLAYKTATNGFEALKKVEEEDFDIIFMDIIMPEMDGITAAEQIRSGSRQKDIPIYALSASTMPEDIEKCRRAGMNGHISKPVKLQDITMALRDSALEVKKVVDQGDIEVTLPESDDIINVEQALGNLNANKKLYHDLLLKFSREYSPLDMRMKETLKSDDPNAARVFFHSIKGVSKTLGAGKLSESSEKLEEMILQGTKIQDSREMQEFLAHAVELDIKLKNFFKDAV
ncbi:MAG: cache domain-containing protein [Deferribacterales bacterium]